MRKRIRRPSPALVISVVALFVALGGTGYAALTVTGKNVKNNSLTGKDVKNRSLTGKDVKGNSLSGSQIRESGLGKVPSAGTADTANTANSANTANTANSAGTAANVAGSTVRKFSFTASADAAPTEILNVGGLRLVASCTAGNTGPPIFLPFLALDVVASTTAAEANLVSSGQNAFGDGEVEGTDDGNAGNDDLSADDENINAVSLIVGGLGAGFGTGGTNDVSLLPDFGGGPGTTHFRSADGSQVTVHWTATDGIFVPCVFNGYAVAG